MSADTTEATESGQGKGHDVQVSSKRGASKTAKEESERKPRTVRGGFQRRGGRRLMKEYPVTFTELIGLGGLGLTAGGTLSAGSFFLSTWWQLSQNFAFSPPKDPTVVAHWQGVQDMALVGAVIMYIVTAVILCVGGAVCIVILRDTDHGEE